MKRLTLYGSLYIAGLFLFALISYSLTDPNLVLSNNEIYWQFQQWLWKHIFNNPPFQAQLFFFLFSFLIFAYLLLVQTLEKYAVTKNIILLYGTLGSFLLLVSYNALSHDIFNYIFNAKMVLHYGMNPHRHVALDIPYDDWLRFMHNVHTTAPYGYGWTGLSLLPSFLGFNKFILTFLLFKVWALVSYITLVILAIRTGVHNKYLVLLNPLLLIEVLSSGHNDLFMMVPALLALKIFATKNNVNMYLLATLLLILSISIKFATLTLLPLVILLLAYNHFDRMKSIFATLRLPDNWSLYASLLLFVPLVTERSQQFHPWYLLWSLVWLFYFPKKETLLHRLWKYVLLTLSFSSLYRYLPWIYDGGFSSATLLHQKMITWIPATIVILIFTCFYLFKKYSSKAH